METLNKRFDNIETDLPIVRIGPEDFISRVDGLVWNYPLRVRTMDQIGARFIGVVRVWVLIHHTETDEYFIFTRARSYRLSADRPTNFEEAYERASGEIYQSLEEDIEKFDYLEASELLAWTFWHDGQKAYAGVRRKKARRRRKR